MINGIWLGMIIIGFVFAAVNGRMDAFTGAVFDGAKNGVTVSFGLISVLVFWLGIMKIAEDAGLLRTIARVLGPVVRFLFPDVPKGHPAIGYILSNMSANLLGLGNAATPMGIKAMQELQTLNPDKDTATPAMCTLLALNTASITLIPATLIAIRLNYGSADPAGIVGTTLAATLVATLAAVFADRLCRRLHLLRRPPGPPPARRSRTGGVTASPPPAAHSQAKG
ncbi:nucleoside recognition domain-containing protein [Paenibacillus sp. URB8-2]|uniref:nucleoside recognition domain-containing protein n=1 Tax=Paenibacillus sp. URB8-2 TaxID=2741301 RepID=UPI0015C2ABBE|nr:nucleoside recognition domain-containing protein [Paenibacillus sp. URB8-2]BCG59964.1 spore maturation protein A [Paenibacillus sp. URB8-2]